MIGDKLVRARTVAQPGSVAGWETTFAYAYQNVFTTGGPVHFTAEANQQLAEIRKALQAIRTDIENIDSWPTPPECEGIDPDLLNACKLEARLQPLKEQFVQVLMTGLVSAGPPPEETAPTEPAAETTPAETETTETATEPTETETTTEPTETTTDTTMTTETIPTMTEPTTTTIP